MSDQGYAVVFDGKIAEGQELATVKERLAALFKLPAPQVEKLFSGGSVTLKRGLSSGDAERLAALFAKAGAVCQLVNIAADTQKAAAAQPLSIDALAQHFRNDFERRSPALTYQLGLAALALLMLMLPLAYLAMIVGAGAGVVWYASGGVPLPTSHSLHALMFYTLPIVAGVMVILFLLKPLFAPRRIERLPMELTRVKQPLLFAFVDAVADKVGAPRPKNIEVDCEVNAAASFYRGFSGLLRNELTLTIGIPLIAGMNTRQLAGVLAHEFGHFSQRGGMLATYVIRRITFAFQRAVEERDAWDAWLEEWVEAREGALVLPAIAAQLGIGSVRKVLALFGKLADLLSYYMLRQMEFDADTYEARVAGSAQFRDTSLQLRRLGRAFNEVYRELGELWQRRQLVDDLPVMIARKARQLPSQALREIEESLQEAHQDLFSTHPPDEARINAAQQLDAQGIFTMEQPAELLLRNADEVARQVTLRFYRHDLGLNVKPEQLVSKETMAALVDQAKAQEVALKEYLRGVFTPSRFLAPGDTPGTATLEPAQRKQQLDVLIAKIRLVLPEIDRNRAEFVRLNEQLDTAYAAHLLGQQSNTTLQALAQEISRSSYVELQSGVGAVLQKMAVAEQLQMTRLALALQGARQGQGLPAEQRERIEAVINATRALADLQEVRNQLYLAGAALYFGMKADAMLQNRSEGKESLPVPFYETVLRDIRQCGDNIASLLQRLPYPFERIGGAATLWEHMQEGLPAVGESAYSHVEYVQVLNGQLMKLYEQSMRFLAEVALHYERQLGVEPLSIQVRSASG